MLEAIRYTPAHTSQALIASVIAMGLQVGTGGAATASYYKARGERGYAYAHYTLPRAFLENPAVRTPAEDLARIRAVLKPAVKDLAGALGVSRQAVYDWQAGRPITGEHAGKLANLARAADLLGSEGLSASSQVLRRPIASGRSFFDIIRSGGAAEGAARRLVAVLRREQEQRKVLESRLVGRKRPTLSADDFGVPMLDEQS